MEARRRAGLRGGVCVFACRGWVERDSLKRNINLPAAWRLPI